uniref:Polycomb group ring finger 3 n=1 Tax=Mastacembelus armatus TaxID=205130 RepID=A0A3Q3RZY2_9TELE
MAVLGNPDMLTRKIKLCHINAHITCRLCEGYLIDATTVTECLHTFCRSCLVKYLEENNTCPTCRIVIHQSHPLQYIGHDRTMQDIVYKLVPGLQEAEIKKQREFYQKLGMEVPGDIKGELCNIKSHLDQRNGDAKSEDMANKEAGEEKPEEDNDYHRSDEQVSLHLLIKAIYAFHVLSPGSLIVTASIDPVISASFPGQHLLGMQQQQASRSETQVDPLFSSSHSPPPQEVHCQKA